LAQSRPGPSLDKQRQDLLDQLAALKQARDDAIANGDAGSVVDKVLQAIQDRQAALER